ncbi:MAG: cell filamentation protein Fic [Candidatus Hydrogenedentota bacterium]|nr:MAG: cell filamentation protein Fic [Candidatus Hydrogenedentota bacterium]
MKFEDYKSGVYKQQYKYKSFSPTLVNHDWTWGDPSINTLLEEATRHLSELNAFSTIVPNIDLFMHMHVATEANASSRIEGTQNQLEDAVVSLEQVDTDKREDWEEVNNYIDAMNFAIDRLDSLPLSNRLLRDTHAILLRGVRGSDKTPGEFRISQNWIGGTSLKDAIFIPPKHINVPELMSDLEKFWHNTDIHVPHLIRIALSHYQFETIHPFQDGNGRIGRLLITLYLISNGFLSKPSLYLSSYLEKHKSAYIDALMLVRDSNDLGHWIKFFLLAISETSQKGIAAFKKILDLRDRVEQQVDSLGRKSSNGRKVIELLYKKPIINAQMIADSLDVSKPTAHTLISDFQDLGILHEFTGFKRNRMFIFKEYLDCYRTDFS